MNGNGRLYRSSSDAVLGGVASGLAHYFKVDPILFRIGFVALAWASGGMLILGYLALWLLLPTAGSTASDTGGVLRENLDEIGARARRVTNGFGGPRGAGQEGPQATPANHANTANQANQPPQSYASTYASEQGQAQGGPQTQIVPSMPAQGHRQGLDPRFLIGLGVLFLMANMGFFRAHHPIFLWPALLIGLGVLMISRHNRA